ncbi:MAG: hypothetical protein LBL73_07080 [Synergistaceae bacterium]|nr:hypothetical protein [Synergistaceae bacterium]
MLTALEGLDLRRVYVGVPEEKSGRPSEEGEAAQMNNATLARIHEHGSPAAHIPARPFLEPGIMHAHDQIVADMREGADKALDELNPRAVEAALNKAGMHAATQVKKEFTDNDWEPLSDVTIRGVNKRKDGKFSLNDEDYAIKGRKKTKKMQEAFAMASIFGDSLDEIRGDYKPLIDTGSLRQSISYVVKGRGE